MDSQLRTARLGAHHPRRHLRGLPFAVFGWDWSRPPPFLNGAARLPPNSGLRRFAFAPFAIRSGLLYLRGDGMNLPQLAHWVAVGLFVLPQLAHTFGCGG
jgi:hypothetical protein